MAIVYGTNYGRPTLDLNFARNKSLIDTISGQNLVTFTRSSTGTYVDSDGLIKTASANTPRFDHNPVTGECLGLLVEESRPNNESRSSSPSISWSSPTNASWSTVNITSPDGSTGVDLLTENSANGSHLISKFYDNDYSRASFSLFVKPNGRYRFNVTISSTSGSSGTFNLLTNTVSTGGNAGNGFIQPFPNGWYRVGLSHIIDGDNRGYMNITLYDNNGSSTYTGDGISGMYIWGIQYEKGGYSFPTSYIPTSGSTVTRSADSASITGTNFSRWYNQNESTIFYSYRTNQISPTAYSVLWELRNSTDRRLFGYHSSSAYGTFSPNGGSTIGFYSVNSAYQLNKVASSFSLSNVNSTANGATPGTGNHTVISPSDQILFGYGTDVRNTHCLNRLTYYPTRLQNFQLQQLTK